VKFIGITAVCFTFGWLMLWGVTYLMNRETCSDAGYDSTRVSITLEVYCVRRQGVEVALIDVLR
jgi:hypothetical protein